MFRKMRRIRQQVSPEVCRELLKTAGRGVLSVIGDDGYPYGIPLNFYYEEAENTVYFHCAKQGHKIDAIRSCDKACFTVWANDGKDEGDWAWYVTSVIAMGTAELVDDVAIATDKVRKLGLKYSPLPDEVEEEIASSIHHVQLVAFHIQHMTGKRVHEK